MFLFRGKKKEEKPKKSKSSDLAALGLDPSLFEDPDDADLPTDDFGKNTDG